MLAHDRQCNAGVFGCLFLALLAVVLGPGRAQAQDTWISTASGNWSNAGNWSSSVPVSSATTSLTFVAGNYTATNDLAPSPFQLNSLAFGSSGLAILADIGQGLSFARRQSVDRAGGG